MIRRYVRRFLYRVGFKRFYNGRFTTEELLARARERALVLTRRRWLERAAREELAYLRSFIEFLEGEVDVRSKFNVEG